MKMYCINHVFTEFLNSATAGECIYIYIQRERAIVGKIERGKR